MGSLGDAIAVNVHAASDIKPVGYEYYLKECGACGGDHVAVFVELKFPIGAHGYTHVAWCENAQKPVVRKRQ